VTAGSTEGVATAVVEPPELRRATFDDFPAIHRLESEFLTNIFSTDDRRALFEDNPLWPRVAAHWPVGWVLEDADGRLVGAVTNVPSPYVLSGEEKICGNGLAWAVTPEHRGYAALLMDEYFMQEEADLVVSSNVGVGATPIWQAYGTAVPLGDWSRASYVVTNRRAFTREVLAMKGVPLPGALSVPAAAALALKDRVRPPRLPETPDDVEVGESRAFDDRFDGFWEELRAQNPGVLLAVRDRATLAWHFRIPLRGGRLRIFTASRGGRMRAWCLVKEYERPSGMRSMKIVDYQTVDTSADLLPGLVRAAVDRCAAEGLGMLEHNGCDLPKLAAFDRYAPYRIIKAAWSFYFVTSDPDLQATLARPDAWDPSEYDGDASFI
jgi:hypothetical protein